MYENELQIHASQAVLTTRVINSYVYRQLQLIRLQRGTLKRRKLKINKSTVQSL